MYVCMCAFHRSKLNSQRRLIGFLGNWKRFPFFFNFSPYERIYVLNPKFSFLNSHKAFQYFYSIMKLIIIVPHVKQHLWNFCSLNWRIMIIIIIKGFEIVIKYKTHCYIQNMHSPNVLDILMSCHSFWWKSSSFVHLTMFTENHNENVHIRNFKFNYKTPCMENRKLFILPNFKCYRLQQLIFCESRFHFTFIFSFIFHRLPIQFNQAWNLVLNWKSKSYLGTFWNFKYTWPFNVHLCVTIL